MSTEPTAQLRDVRVLIVEDHDDTRESLDAYLTMSGAVVLSASTALEALPQVVMCDVVVTDLAMSGRDGRWLVDQVGTSARPVPVIAVTGYDQDYDLSGRGRDAGCPAPPAQIPACAANALGSCLGF
jgi:CheY-like chemotaxis protein